MNKPTQDEIDRVKAWHKEQQIRECEDDWAKQWNDRDRSTITSWEGIPLDEFTNPDALKGMIRFMAQDVKDTLLLKGKYHERTRPNRSS